MKLKRALSLFLVVILSVSLFTACGDNVESENTSKENKLESTAEGTDGTEGAEAPQGLQPEEGAELIVWENNDEEQDFMYYAIEKFNEIYPEVTITYEPVSPTDAKDRIALDGPAGVGPDVFAAPHDHLGYLVETGYILPNNEFSADYNNIFVPAAVTGVTYGDQIYGYPLSLETYALFYNKDIVDEPAKTWDEIKEFAKEFNNPAENKYALFFESENSYYSYIFLSGYGAPLFGPSGTDKMNPGFDSKEAIEAMKFFQTIRTDICDVQSADISYDVMAQGFENGSFAYIINGPWGIQPLREIGMNFGVTELPILPNGNHPESFTGIRGLYVSAFTEYPIASQLFADFCTSLEMTDSRYNITGQIPARMDYEVDDEYIAGIMKQNRYATPMPAIPEMDLYWGTMDPTYANIWDGADPETELKAAQKAMISQYE